MTDRDRAEMRVLCDQFRQAMAREAGEAPLFDEEARVRIGEMIGRALRQTESAFSYGRGGLSHSCRLRQD